METACSAKLSPVGAACLLVLVGVGAPSWAQQATAPPAPPVALERIVVTAQKRLELLEDVPAAVSAYSGTQIEQLGLNNATELRFVSPSVNFTQSANARGEGFSIRGVGTSIFSDSIEQSVGFMVDGVVVGRTGQASGDMLDVQRVEILRGPQGMLFGKNASAGLISVITTKPRLGVNSAEGRLSVGSFNEVKSQLIGNIALGETAALRLAFGSTKADGNVQNIISGQSLNNRDDQMMRAKLLVNPTDKLDVQINADASQRNTLCCAWTARSAPAATTFGRLNLAAGITASPANLQVAAGAPFFQNSKNSGLSVELNYDLGWATLTSLSAYRTWELQDNNDPDLLPINILDRNSGDSSLTQKTQEVRLTSPSGGAFEWVGGVYWYDQRNTTLGDQAGTLGAGANILGSFLNTTTTNTSKAIFGQVTARVSDRFKLIGGARYTSDTVGLDLLQGKSIGAVASIPGRYNGAIMGEVNKTNVSWRLTAQADLNRDNMLYGTVAKGFKGAGINTLSVTSPTLEVIEPEIPTTVEAGMRSTLMGGRAQISVAAFKTRFENYQAQVFDQNVNPGRFRVTNAGSLESQGIEMDIVARPVPALTLTAAFSHIQSTYGDFKNIACYTGQPISPFGTARTSPRDCIRTSAAANATALTEGTGNPLTNSPMNTVALSARYETSMSGFKFAGQLNYFWRDKVSFSAAGDPNLVQDAYGLLGASVGIGSLDGKWNVSIYGKNLANQNFAANVISNPVLNAPGVYSQFTSPDARRSVGVVMNVKF